MKKIVKIGGVILVFILLALVLIPYFFKDKLVEKVKEEANKSLNAELEFGDVDLTFFSHFPSLTFELQELKIIGIDHFEGIELINVKSFEVTIGLGKLIKGELPEIQGLYIHNATINALVHPSGVANWDIVKVTEDAEVEEEAEVTDEEDSFSMHLNYYEITESHIYYEDQSAATLMKIEDFNHSGSGNFASNDFTLKTKSSIANFLVEYEDVKYVNNWKLEASIDVDVDLEKYRFVLSDNEIKVNELLLRAEGEVEMPDSAIYMDLKVDAPNIDLRQLFSLLPPSYTSDMDGIAFSGTSSFSSWFKGNYTDTSYPLFAIDLNVSNGSFKHKDLPKSATNIEITSHVELPDEHNMDALWIDISKFNLNLGGSIISSGFTLHHPETSMDFTSRLSAVADLSNLKDVLPNDVTESYVGIIKANLKADGSLTEIEEENYDNLNAGGKLQVENFEYHSDQFTMPVIITKALMNFKMDEVNLEAFEANIGESDFMADGTLRNFIPYALFDKELYGELNAQSHNLNSDELIALMVVDSTPQVIGDVVESDSLSSKEVIVSDTISEILPKNIHFLLKTGISKLKYDNIDLVDFQGDLELKDGVLNLRNCSSKVFDGEIKLNGKFDETFPANPIAEFDFVMKDLNIKQSAGKIEMIQKYAPVSKYTSGSYSGKVRLTTLLDKEWNPIYKSVYSKGNLKTKGVKIEGFDILDKIAALTQMQDVLDQEFENVDIEYEIIDGKGYIKPFDFKIDQLKGTSSGSIDLDENIDFDVNMDVPTEMLGDGAGLLLGQLAGALSSFGLPTETPENIAMDIKITGTIDKPIIKPNFAGLSGTSAKEVVKEKIEEEIEKAKEEVFAKASEEAEKILADAKKQADDLLAEAQKNVDLLKEEGYAQADKLVEEANGMFEQIAAKAAASEMKKQIDKQATNVMVEAKKQADKILDDAQKQADRLKK